MQTLDHRKQAILYCIIQDYLKAAEPVGSQTIAQKYNLGISPATIRHEMAELEEKGFLVQPHHSAGRIPSDKGYRFYVDYLMKLKRLTQKEEQYITDEYRRSERNLEHLLHQTLHILSALSHYTALAFAPENKVHSWGLTNIIRQPEFSQAEKIKRILEVLEQEALLVEIIKEYTVPDSVTIKIGSENKYKEIEECSLIITSYKIHNVPAGALGVLGPTRMVYSKTTTIVESVANALSLMLSEVEV